MNKPQIKIIIWGGKSFKAFSWKTHENSDLKLAFKPDGCKVLAFSKILQNQSCSKGRHQSSTYPNFFKYKPLKSICYSPAKECQSAFLHKNLWGLSRDTSIHQCPFGKIGQSIPSITESNIKCFLILMSFSPQLSSPSCPEEKHSQIFLVTVTKPISISLWFSFPHSLFPFVSMLKYLSAYPVCPQSSSAGLCLCSLPCYCRSDTSCLHSLQQNCTSVNKVVPLAALAHYQDGPLWTEENILYLSLRLGVLRLSCLRLLFKSSFLTSQLSLTVNWRNQ